MTDGPAVKPVVRVEPDRDPARPLPLSWEEYRRRVLGDWRRLLDTDPDEPSVHKFLELHPSMVPGGSGDVGPGGHHGSTHSALFSEPELTGAGRQFEPDFMWVTRSTSLITPILIEIERPSKRWFRQDGRPTAKFTQAHDQLNDWRSWFARDANKVMFRDRFMFGERYDDRPLEPQYVLIFGRASEFEPTGGHSDPQALRHKRDQQRAADESFRTFDSLVPKADHAESMTVRMTATGAEAIAFSPLYGTDTRAGQVLADIRGVDAALDRTVMITEDRRQYLKSRFEHWSNEDRQSRDRDALYLRTLGTE
ncbi:hypothetical protein GCM10023339_41390 [Alloalcanivorax gelatiniphagus]